MTDDEPVQMTEALAMISHALRTRTSRFSFVIRRVANERASVTARGRPSGTATTMTVTVGIIQLVVATQIKIDTHQR